MVYKVLKALYISSKIFILIQTLNEKINFWVLDQNIAWKNKDIPRKTKLKFEIFDKK